MSMKFTYSKLGILCRRIYRYFFPVPKSSYTLGEVEDICSIHLVPPQKLEGFFEKCVNILKNYKGEDIGDYLEFGVFNGSSIGSMMKTAERMNINNMRFFGFDAFQGLPEGSENEDDGVWKKGFYTCSFDKMQSCLRKRELHPENVNRVNGWYNETLNDELTRKYTINNLGIVFIDCDTYSSSKAVLDYIGPLLTKPAIFCFDDWKLNDLDIKEMGEYKAFNEFLSEFSHFKAISIPSYNRKSRSFIVMP